MSAPNPPLFEATDDAVDLHTSFEVAFILDELPTPERVKIAMDTVKEVRESMVGLPWYTPSASWLRGAA